MPIATGWNNSWPAGDERRGSRDERRITSRVRDTVGPLSMPGPGFEGRTSRHTLSWQPVVKALQRSFITYDNAYIDVPPGAIIEKTFYLEAYEVAGNGSGFQQPTRTSLEIFRPCSVEG